MSARAEMEKVQDEVVKVLRERPFLKGVKILSADDGDLVAKIERALGSITASDQVGGVCITVEALEIDLAVEPLLGKIVITCEENPIIARGSRGAGKTSAMLAQECVIPFSPRQAGNKAMLAKKLKLIDDTGSKIKYQVEGTFEAVWGKPT